MSATHRTKAERAENHDFYRTPAWCVRAIAEHLPVLEYGVNAPVFDPCAGNGAILDAFCDADDEPPHPQFGRGAERHLAGIELQADLAAKIRPSTYAHGEPLPTVITVRDALSPEPWGVRGHVVMNPPFSHAEAFVRRAISEVAPHGGSVFALLRLGFIESAERADLHLEYPSHAHVLPRRPSFCLAVRCVDKACGWRAQLPVDGPRPKTCPTCTGYLATSATDASAYAWFEWGPKALGGWSILDVEDEDPVHVPWGAPLVDVPLAVGFSVRAPGMYPDGTRISSEHLGELVGMAVDDLEIREHITARLKAGVPAANLRRVHARRISERLVAMMLAGVRIATASPASPTSPAKPKRAKAKPVEAQPAELGNEDLETQLDEALARADAEEKPKAKRSRKPKPVQTTIDEEIARASQ